MSAKRLEIGEHGDIAYREHSDGRVTASFYYRNSYGVRRRIEAREANRSVARRVALRSFEAAMAAGAVGVYSARTTFSRVAVDWLESVADLVSSGRRSPRTLALYRTVLRLHVDPWLGELRISELTTARIDAFLRERQQVDGHAVAKLCRSVASGVCGFAVRRDAMRFNPVRDVSPLEAQSSRQARALTEDECRDWLAIVDGSEFGRRKDLPDLIRFLLGTGCRLGEALALTWASVDFERALVHVTATLIRVPGEGLVVKGPKTAAGVRVLRIPAWLVEILRHRRAGDGRSAGAVFPDAVGGHRDGNNVERDHRAVRRGTRFEWVVPHTYRKTVATMLDDKGLSARTIADQLGHSRISMTQDVYMGRRAVDVAASVALESLAMPVSDAAGG